MSAHTNLESGVDMVLLMSFLAIVISSVGVVDDGKGDEGRLRSPEGQWRGRRTRRGQWRRTGSGQGRQQGRGQGRRQGSGRG